MKFLHRDLFKTHKLISPKLIMVIGSVVLFSVGCVSQPPPTNESLWAAEQAIDNAERARVNQYAASELSQAREILNQARMAIIQKDMLKAERLAQQSKVTAQLASVRAETIKAQQINTEMETSITQLKQEMERNQGTKL